MGKKKSKGTNRKIDRMLEKEINKRKGKRGIGEKDDMNELQDKLSYLCGEDVKIDNAEDAKNVLSSWLSEKSMDNKDDKQLGFINKLARKAGIK